MSGLYPALLGPLQPIASDGPPNPVADLFVFLFARLSQDATLTGLVGGSQNPRIYESFIPEGDGTQDDSSYYPAVVFTLLNFPYDVGNGSLRGIGNPTLQVVAVGRTEDLTTLRPIAGRIDALFSGQYTGYGNSLIISGGYSTGAVCPPPMVENGVVYRSLGGEYELFCNYP